MTFVDYKSYIVKEVPFKFWKAYVSSYSSAFRHFRMNAHYVEVTSRFYVSRIILCTYVLFLFSISVHQMSSCFQY